MLWLLSLFFASVSVQSQTALVSVSSSATVGCFVGDRILQRGRLSPRWIEAVGEEVESFAFNLSVSKSTFILYTADMEHKSQTLDLTNVINLLNPVILNMNS